MRIAIRSIRSPVALGALALFLSQCVPPESQPLPSYLPDLSIRISCADPHDAAFEAAAVTFLGTADFEVLNVSQARRDHLPPGHPVRSLTAEVVGRRSGTNVIVHLLGHGNVQGEHLHDAFLYTRPPTKRELRIEARIERFAADFAESGVCEVGDPQRHQNGPEAKEMFEEFRSVIQAWYEEASSNRQRP